MLMGVPKKETLNFRGLSDFGVRGIVNQSDFLKSNAIQKDEYLKVIKQLKSNKILKAALTDPEAKQALLDAIQSMISELQSNK